MAKETFGRRAVRFFRNANDISKIVTGRPLDHVIRSAIDAFDINLSKKPAAEIDVNDPYFILGVHPDAADFVVKAAYRAQMKVYHPDHGNPNPEMAAKLNDAYNKIMKQRHPAPEDRQ